MRTTNIIALILIIVGAVNWGLVGAFGFNLVSAIFGATSVLARIIYVLVGLSGLYCIALFPLVTREWSEASVSRPGLTPTPST